RPDVRTDAELPAPQFIEEAVEAGRVMSGAVREPFVRLDFYEDHKGIVFGEVTPAPGGNQIMRPDVDARLGAMWEAAEARLRTDAIARGLHDLSRGSHPITS
ncbi:ATP-grasp fold amidoligase family protein, partial [Georgenia sp. 10Sc9-8]|nr:ATP-grasp fold amidoligase family protein [Georgenia halotolerans]